MNLLGSVGQLYMFVLLVLLFLGSGFALWSFINFLMERNNTKPGAIRKPEQVKVQGKSENIKIVNGKVKGGLFMANNGWIKLAVFSFVGILVSVAVLGLVSAGNPYGTNIHQQHQQQNGMGNVNPHGGMNVNAPMGNMQMQGGMNGNMMPMNGGMSQNEMMMMQQLNQMQMQLNQMQQQMGMMNGGMGGNMQMQQGGTGSMGGMGMMGGMMGGMGMMNMGGSMSSMPQNGGSMSSMPQSGGSMSNMPQSGGSSGGMGGMGMMGGMM